MKSAAEIYARAFAEPGYCDPSATEPRIAYAMAWIESLRPAAILDVGCGRGRLLEEADARIPGITLESCDAVEFCDLLSRHTQIDLASAEGAWWLAAQQVDVVTCLDVLEHLPPWRVPHVVAAMVDAAPRAVVTVASNSDTVAGMQLHLTQLTRPWWDALLQRHYRIIHTATAHKGKMYAYRLERK